MLLYKIHESMAPTVKLKQSKSSSPLYATLIVFLLLFFEFVGSTSNSTNSFTPEKYTTLDVHIEDDASHYRSSAVENGTDRTLNYLLFYRVHCYF